MKIEVTEYEKKYSFELTAITQLCGQNIVKKTYVLESIRRYFSTYKYREEQNKWRDNIIVDGEHIGRKFFEVLSISSISDLLMMIKCSKQSLMMEYVKQLMQQFDWQVHLRTINEELELMFQMMNAEINQLGNIELSYTTSNVWDMIQKSDIVGNNQIMLDEQNSYDLLIIFLNLIEEIMKTNPRKILVILENIDHLLSRTEYSDVLDKLLDIGRKYNIYFILSTSIDGYIRCNKELCPGIKIFGDVDFQMPEFDKLSYYINEHYPYHKHFSDEEIQNDLCKVIQKIGQNNFLYNIEESVICKLINQTLLIHNKWPDNERIPELTFLKS